MRFQELTVYKKSFELAMDIFETSKSFPKEETYSLTDQIRRSSRSVSANFAEAYRKRRYPAHFLSKLTDCDSENGETQVWIEYAFRCKYISTDEHQRLHARTIEVGKLLGSMISNHKNFL